MSAHPATGSETSYLAAAHNKSNTLEGRRHAANAFCDLVEKRTGHRPDDEAIMAGPEHGHTGSEVAYLAQSRNPSNTHTGRLRAAMKYADLVERRTGSRPNPEILAAVGDEKARERDEQWRKEHGREEEVLR